jgi:hypothetical protein
MMGGDMMGGSGDDYGGLMMTGDIYGDMMGSPEGEYGGMGDINGTSIDLVGENGAMMGFSENEIFYSDNAPSIVIQTGAAIAISTEHSDTLYLSDGGTIMNIDSTTVIPNGFIIGGNGDDALTFTGAHIEGEADLKDGNDTVILNNASNNAVLLNVETVRSSSGIDVIFIGGTSATSIYSSASSDTFKLSGHVGYSDKIIYTDTTHGPDTIIGFEDAGADKLVFSRQTFNGSDTTTVSAMDTNKFVSQAGTQANGSSNFIYSTDRSALYYDADGAAGSEILIANFDPLQTIVATDIIFIA